MVALRLLLAAVVLANVIFLLWNDGWRVETMERLETAIIRLPGLDNVYCQATNGVLHASRYHKLTEGPWSQLTKIERETRIQEMGITVGQNEKVCLGQTNPLRRDLGQFALIAMVLAVTALVGLALYQSIRAWRLGAIS